jgi:hypothetical protein
MAVRFRMAKLHVVIAHDKTGFARDLEQRVIGMRA